MKKMLAGLGFSVVLASGLFANSLMMATTTSTEDTGLLAAWILKLPEGAQLLV